MAHAYFLDSSAILKLYLLEQGSIYIASLPQTDQDILYIAQIAGVEVVSAISRQALGKHITNRKAKAAIKRFREDFANRYVVLMTNDQLIERAMKLAENHSLRAYDDVQLATALIVSQAVIGIPFIFVCADDRLNKVAQVEGLLVENPNNYT